MFLFYVKLFLYAKWSHMLFLKPLLHQDPFGKIILNAPHPICPSFNMISQEGLAWTWVSLLSFVEQTLNIIEDLSRSMKVL